MRCKTTTRWKFWRVWPRHKSPLSVFSLRKFRSSLTFKKVFFSCKLSKLLWLENSILIAQITGSVHIVLLWWTYLLQRSHRKTLSSCLAPRPLSQQWKVGTRHPWGMIPPRCVSKPHVHHTLKPLACMCPTLTIVNVVIISWTADPCHSKEPTRMLWGNSQALLPRF